MKKSILSLFLIFAFYSYSQCQEVLKPKIDPENHMYGYSDKNGEMIIKGKFSLAYNFVNGVAIVRKLDKFGMINMEGKEIVKCKYNSFHIVENSDSLLCFSNGYGTSGLWNKHGKQLIPNKYSSIKYENEAIILYKEARYGIADLTGKILFPVQFKIKPVFYNGIAATAMQVDGCEKWGYITNKGEILVPFDYYPTRPFKKNLGIAGENKFYIFNSHGKKVVEAAFEAANDNFRPIPVKLNSKWGIVGENGYILPCEYDTEFNLNPKYPGLIYVLKNGKSGLIDTTGKIIIPCKYDKINSLSKGRLTYMNNKKMGIDSENGKVIIPAEYDWLSEAYITGKVVVKNDNKFGVLDSDGKIICPIISITEPKFDTEKQLFLVCNESGGILLDNEGKQIAQIAGLTEIETFQNDLARVKKGNLFGFIDNKGKTVVPCIYESLDNFSEKNQLAKAKRNNLFGFIDKQGVEIIPCIYQSIDDFQASEPFVRAEKNGLWGFVNKQGKEIIPFTYKYLEKLSDDLICAYNGEFWGYINIKNETVINFKYTDARYFYNGKAHVTLGNEFKGEIDKSEKRISQNEYDIVQPEQNKDFPRFTDPRDGTVYRTREVGGLYWFDENLKYKPHSICYENNEDLTATHGRLYSIEEAPKACPAGWRLPTDREWSYLNQYSFHEEYGGLHNTTGYHYFGKSGAWWQDSGGNIYDGVYINHDEEKFNLKSDLDIRYIKYYYLSIRCVKKIPKK